MQKSPLRIVIVGGGTAGITVAAQLIRKLKSAKIQIIEPSDAHFYQPLWTLVGAGIVRKGKTMRSQASVIPPGVEWIKDRVARFMPDENCVVTADNAVVPYDFLVVAPGIQIDWHKIEGLEQGLGRDGVCSNYSFATVDATWNAIRSFSGGTAIFTMPNTPVKCGGAPQKIMYLAEHFFRKNGVREGSRIIFATPNGQIFGVQKYRGVLEKIVSARDIETHFRKNLVEVRPDSKEAIFEDVETKARSSIQYDLLHVTPPMSAPDFIKVSALADAQGWLDVDSKTLQHVRYENVFGLGDAANLPTAKTGAAIRKQAPVLVKNLMAQALDKPLPALYDGYTSCPIVTGFGKLILAEFDYNGEPAETFPFNQAKERTSMYLLKRYLLPVLYWAGMLKGRA